MSHTTRDNLCSLIRRLRLFIRLTPAYIGLLNAYAGFHNANSKYKIPVLAITQFCYFLSNVDSEKQETRQNSDKIGLICRFRFYEYRGVRLASRLKKKLLYWMVRKDLHEIRTKVEATRQHFLAECDNIWRRWQIEMFVTPHLASRSASCLYFINNQRDAFLIKHYKNVYDSS